MPHIVPAFARFLADSDGTERIVGSEAISLPFPSCSVRVVLVIFMAMPSYADWTRLVVSSKGGFFDKPEAETLDYFTRCPSLHDGLSDFQELS